MQRTTITLMLGLLACRSGTPATPALEPEAEPQSPMFVEQVQTTPNDPEEPLAAIAKGMCPAMVGDAPSAFFEDRVLVRLPAGVDSADLSDFGRRWWLQSSRQFHMNDCRDGDEHGAMINHVALTLTKDQDALSLEAARDFALTEFGYSMDEDQVITEGFKDPNGILAMWVVASPGSETRALVVIKRSAGFVAAILLEANEDVWPALVDTFVESGKTLLVVP